MRSNIDDQSVGWGSIPFPITEFESQYSALLWVDRGRCNAENNLTLSIRFDIILVKGEESHPFVLTLNLRKNTGESYGLKEDDR